MTGETGDSAGSTLPPDEAFSVLGNESRINILQVLGEADDRLSFSELYDRVDVPDSGQFSYHLNKLRSHFVHETAAGYEPTQAGLRVIEAVLSGAITEPSTVEPERIDAGCPYCGAAIEVRYDGERVVQRCTECAGGFRGRRLPDGTLERGYLPPAGLAGRDPEELVVARNAWSVIEQVAMANDVCPRCSGHVDLSIRVCDDHAGDGICERCNRRNAVLVVARCRNCPHERTGYILAILLGEPAFRAFLERRGIDLFSLPPETGGLLVGYDEELLNLDPFEGRFTFTVDGDRIRLTVDGEPSVVDVTRPDA